jgi:hypothetical protein
MKRFLFAAACAVLALSACKPKSEVLTPAPDEIVVAASRAAEESMKFLVTEDVKGLADTVPLADRKRYFQQSQIYGFGILCGMGEPKISAQDFVMKDQESKKWTPAQITFIATFMKMNQDLMQSNLAGYECTPAAKKDLAPYFKL